PEASAANRATIRDSAASSSAEPRAPLSLPPSKLMFFALPSDQRGDRKRCSSADSGNASRGKISTPPPSSVRIATSCASGPSAGRQLATSRATMSVIGGTCVLARQLGRAHQEFVDGARALAALAYRPDDQGLAAARVAGGKQLRDRRSIMLGVGLDVAARIVFDAQLFEHPDMHRMQITH